MWLERNAATPRLAVQAAVPLYAPGTPAATLLIDRKGIVRRASDRLLAGAELSEFVGLWRAGKDVYDAFCTRCHGEDGDLDICQDWKPLNGIGGRRNEAQFRGRLRPGEINEREVLVRGQFYKKRDIDAVIAYVAGL